MQSVASVRKLVPIPAMRARWLRVLRTHAIIAALLRLVQRPEINRAENSSRGAEGLAR